jgi:hypothetical protein
MSGAIHPLPQYAFMAWCLFKKHRDNFTFYLFILHNRLSAYKNFCPCQGLLGYDAAWCSGRMSTFWRTLLPPFSGILPQHTWYHNSKGLDLNLHICENLKSCIKFLYFTNLGKWIHTYLFTDFKEIFDSIKNYIIIIIIIITFIHIFTTVGCPVMKPSSFFSILL